MSNFDRMVARRMAKTGETWATAARRVRGRLDDGTERQLFEQLVRTLKFRGGPMPPEPLPSEVHEYLERERVHCASHLAETLVVIRDACGPASDESNLAERTLSSVREMCLVIAGEVQRDGLNCEVGTADGVSLPMAVRSTPSTSTTLPEHEALGRRLRRVGQFLGHMLDAYAGRPCIPWLEDALIASRRLRWALTLRLLADHRGASFRIHLPNRGESLRAKSLLENDDQWRARQHPEMSPTTKLGARFRHLGTVRDAWLGLLELEAWADYIDDDQPHVLAYVDRTETRATPSPAQIASCEWLLEHQAEILGTVRDTFAARCDTLREQLRARAERDDEEEVGTADIMELRSVTFLDVGPRDGRPYIGFTHGRVCGCNDLGACILMHGDRPVPWPHDEMLWPSELAPLAVAHAAAQASN